MFGSWIARISEADCPCPAAIFLLPEAQSSALSASHRRPIDRPPAGLQHHDLPRRRQARSRSSRVSGGSRRALARSSLDMPAPDCATTEELLRFSFETGSIRRVPFGRLRSAFLLPRNAFVGRRAERAGLPEPLTCCWFSP
jgi:hypothetical protein